MRPTDTRNSDGAIWLRVLEPAQPELSPEAARSLLTLKFSPADQERMHQLAAKARQGSLLPQEQEEIDAYGRVGSLLAILQSQARLSLKHAGNANGPAR